MAELLRNTGRFTLADVLSFRMRQRPIRTAAAITTLAVSFFYLVAQMAGAGGLVALLLGVEGENGQRATIAVVGIIMVIYVLVGGMKGTTWVQIVKAAVLISGAFIHDRPGCSASTASNLSSLLGDAVEKGGETGPALLESRQAVRPHRHHQAGLHLAGACAGARHRRPAARADAVLHRADGAGGAPLSVCGRSG